MHSFPGRNSPKQPSNKNALFKLSELQSKSRPSATSPDAPVTSKSYRNNNYFSLPKALSSRPSSTNSSRSSNSIAPLAAAGELPKISNLVLVPVQFADGRLASAFKACATDKILAGRGRPL